MKIQRTNPPRPLSGPRENAESTSRPGAKTSALGREIASSAQRLVAGQNSSLGQLMKKPAVRAGEVQTSEHDPAKIKAIAGQIEEVAETGSKLISQIEEIEATAGEYAKEIIGTARGPIDAIRNHIADGGGPDDGDDGGSGDSGGGEDGSAGGQRPPRPHPHLDRAKGLVAEKKAAVEHSVHVARTKVGDTKADIDARADSVRDTIADSIDTTKQAIRDQAEDAGTRVIDAAAPIVAEGIQKATPVVREVLANPFVEDAVSAVPPPFRNPDTIGTQVVGEAIQVAKTVAEPVVQIGEEAVQEVTYSLRSGLWTVTSPIRDVHDSIQGAVGSVETAVYYGKRAAGFVVDEAKWIAGWSRDTVAVAKELAEIVGEAPGVGSEIIDQTKDAVETSRLLAEQTADLMRSLAQLEEESASPSPSAATAARPLRA